MKRRAFSLTELLVVLAILAVLAALLFPVFARAKERSKATNCAMRLRNFALTLNLYRADHDGLGYRWSFDPKRAEPGLSSPFGAFEGMKGYLGDGAVLDCLEPNPDPILGSTRIVYRTTVTRPDARRPSLIVEVPARPKSGAVVAACPHHAHGAWDPRYAGSSIQSGHYPFVREDASMGIARSEEVRLGFYDERGWYETPQRFTTSNILRFPGEPWPPAPED